MDTNPKSWLDRILGFALALVAIGLLLQWAWHLLRPLLPLLAIGLVVAIAVQLVIRHQRNRYW